MRPGDCVVVQGIGAVGLSTIALARLAGAVDVIAIGGPGDRAPLAAEMGAEVVLDLDDDVTRGARLAACARMTGGRGADIVIEAAGSPRAVEEAFGLVRDGGVYVIAGHYTNTGSSTINAHEQHQSQAPRHPRLLGQRGAALHDGADDAGASRGRGARGSASARRRSGWMN